MSERYDIEENFKDIFWNGYINETFKICELRKMNSFIQRIYGVFDMPRVKELVKNKKRNRLNEVYLGPKYFKDGTFIYSVKYDEEMKLYFRSHIRTMVSYISNKQLLAYFFQLLEFVDNEEELKALMNNIYSSVVLKKEIIFKKIRNEKKQYYLINLNHYALRQVLLKKKSIF